MSDNRTTELLEGLRDVGNLHEFAELFGFDWQDESDWTWHDVAVKMADDLEQAIAATLGEKPRDRTEEWLLKACNQATQDYVAQLERERDELKSKLEAATLGNGTLTAEQVIEAFKRHCTFYYDSKARNVESVIAEFQAVADELNAELGSGTCELHYGENDDGIDGWYTDCGEWFEAAFNNGRLVHPSTCYHCGRKAVER